eukprot:scaffold142780_cov18-Tisochrysis_lutea.AAC.1
MARGLAPSGRSHPGAAPVLSSGAAMFCSRRDISYPGLWDGYSHLLNDGSVYCTQMGVCAEP